MVDRITVRDADLDGPVAVAVEHQPVATHAELTGVVPTDMIESDPIQSAETSEPPCGRRVVARRSGSYTNSVVNRVSMEE